MANKYKAPNPAQFNGKYLAFEQAVVEFCNAVEPDRMLAARQAAKEEWVKSGRPLPAYARAHVEFAEPVQVLTGTSDGSTASYYELPPGATELQHLISFKNMNSQIGEILRSCYRYGESSHSDQLRDAKKIRFYINAEIERLERYGQ